MSNDLITGASSGLGEASARLLSAEGASVVLGARRVDRIQSLANELTASGGKAQLRTSPSTTSFRNWSTQPCRRTGVSTSCSTTPG